MKAAIVFASVHKYNTYKVVEEISNKENVDLIDSLFSMKTDLKEYDLVGIASGIYYGRFHKLLLRYISKYLPDGKDVFLLCTCGGKPSYKAIEKILKKKNCTIKGTYYCKGYDTFGPFKLFGGIAKGHPDEKDLAGAVEFYREMVK